MLDLLKRAVTWWNGQTLAHNYGVRKGGRLQMQRAMFIMKRVTPSAAG